MKKEKVLVIRLSAMGDVAITIPVLHSFKKKYPNSDLSILTNSKLQPFFENLDIEFIGIKPKEFNGVLGLYKLFKILKVRGFTQVLDCHNVLRTKMLRFFYKFTSTKVFVIDKGYKERKELTRLKNKVLKPLESTFDKYRDVFKKAGYDFQFDFKSIYEGKYKEISFNVESLLDLSKAKKIGIAPFAQHEGKIFNLDKMEEVVKQLTSKYYIYLFGGGDNELKVLRNWAYKYTNCIVVADKINLEEELQLIGKLELMISMDSSNMHLASLVNTPVISIWGATHPYTGFYGWGQNIMDVIQLDLDCRPCSIYGNKICFYNDYRCMERITVDSIVNKVVKKLSDV